MTIEIVITPAGGGHYRAKLDDRVICRSSRQPLLDAARVFLAEGVDPGERISMRHQGMGYPALSSTMGEAAKWEVKDDDVGPRFVPFYDRVLAGRNAPQVRSGKVGATHVARRKGKFVSPG